MKRIAQTFAVLCALAVACTGMPVQAQALAVSLNTEQAAQRFAVGESLERNHDLRAAFAAYSEAGEAGHPLAQKKLGDFYNAGNAAVPRDYEVALKWYQKAREQGVDIGSPFSYPASPIVGARR